MESFPSEYDRLDSEHQMVLSHDTLMALEDEVWTDLQDQVERNFLSQEEAEIQFRKWRNGYIS